MGGIYGVNTIPITSLSYATLINFVYARCGYVESYVAKEKDLQKIIKKWHLKM